MGHDKFDIDYRDNIVSMMDDEIRERLHGQLCPCTEEQFYNAYCVEHLEEFNEYFKWI